MAHPGDPDVTRRIVHASVERQVDGRAGRKLVSLLRRAGLAEVHVEPIVDVDAEGDRDGWLPVLRSRVDVAVQAGAVTVEEGAAWWAEIERGVSTRDDFLSVTQLAVRGRA